MWFLPPGLAEFALVHASVVRRVYRALGLTGRKRAAREQLHAEASEQLSGVWAPRSTSSSTPRWPMRDGRVTVA
eukprot:7027105-Prymnesium_polylepis.1